VASVHSAPVNPAEHAARVKSRARDLGFDQVGITDLSDPPHALALRRWLDQGMAGTMSYMHRQAALRSEPWRIVPHATRAVVLSKGYYVDDPPARPGCGRVAKYARGRDYHSALAGSLEKLATYIRELGTVDTVTRCFVDAGPVPERELAQRAGLGWIGKNTMLISPGRGSYTFLAAIMTDLQLAVDPPFEADRCGTCRRCLDACPTGAFPEPRVLDARRCLSYLTIENHGSLDPALAQLMDEWVFGCDVCQEVCPWNVRFATESSSTSPLEQSQEFAWLELDVLSIITDEEFRTRFRGTALERAGAGGLRRNAQLVRENQRPHA